MLLSVMSISFSLGRRVKNTGLEFPAERDWDDTADGALEANTVALNAFALAGRWDICYTLAGGRAVTRHIHFVAQVSVDLRLAHTATYRLAVARNASALSASA